MPTTAPPPAPPPDRPTHQAQLAPPQGDFGVAGPVLSYHDTYVYWKPKPSEQFKRAVKAGGGNVAHNMKLVECPQSPADSLYIDYNNSQSSQINYYIDCKVRDGSVAYMSNQDTRERVTGDVLWSLKETSSFTGDFKIDLFDKAGFLRASIKNNRVLAEEELHVWVNKTLAVGAMGFCGFGGAKAPEITLETPPDFSLIHPSRDRYQVIEGPTAYRNVVAEIDWGGKASFNVRVAPLMDVAVAVALGWIIDRCRCRFELASSRWRGHAGNVFYKGKMNWKRPNAVGLNRGGLKSPG